MGSRQQPTDHTLTFVGAGFVELPFEGQYVRIIEATDDVYLKLDDVSTELVRGKGSQVGSKGFKKVRVRTLVAQTIIVCLSDEPQDEDRNAISLSVSATLVPGNTFEGVTDHTPAGVGAEQVLAADADRLAFTLTNPSTNTGIMRVSGSAATVSANRGAVLEPGQSISRAYNGAVWVYFPVVESVAIDVVKNV